MISSNPILFHCNFDYDRTGTHLHLFHINCILYFVDNNTYVYDLVEQKQTKYF